MTTTAERIKSDVVDELAWDDRVLATDVKVDVDGASVTLSGTVPTHFSRQAAIDDAYQVPGVMKVVDQLGVRYPEVLEIPTDERIRSNVENLLDWNPDIDIRDLTVSVSGGVVTLEGTVDAFWKKALVDNLLQGISGVIALKNQLAIVPEGGITDMAIAETITKALKRRKLVDPDDITVTVENGFVTLGGTVPSVTAEEVAFDAARYTAGVRGVRNDMEIAP